MLYEHGLKVVSSGSLGQTRYSSKTQQIHCSNVNILHILFTLNRCDQSESQIFLFSPRSLNLSCLASSCTTYLVLIVASLSRVNLRWCSVPVCDPNTWLPLSVQIIFIQLCMSLRDFYFWRVTVKVPWLNVEFLAVVFLPLVFRGDRTQHTFYHGWKWDASSFWKLLMRLVSDAFQALWYLGSAEMTSSSSHNMTVFPLRPGLKSISHPPGVKLDKWPPLAVSLCSWNIFTAHLILFSFYCPCV